MKEELQSEVVGLVYLFFTLFFRTFAQIRFWAFFIVLT